MLPDVTDPGVHDQPIGAFTIGRSSRSRWAETRTEQDDEWAVADRRYFSAESMRQLLQPITGELQQDLIAAVA